MTRISTSSENLIIRCSETYGYSQGWERKNIPFLYFIACSLLCNNSVIVILFCSGLIRVRTYWKMPYNACLLSRKAAIDTVRNFASSDILTLVMLKTPKTVFAACPAFRSALMGGCKGTVHARCWHLLPISAALTAKAIGNGVGRPLVTLQK